MRPIIDAYRSKFETPISRYLLLDEFIKVLQRERALMPEEHRTTACVRFEVKAESVLDPGEAIILTEATFVISYVAFKEDAEAKPK